MDTQKEPGVFIRDDQKLYKRDNMNIMTLLILDNYNLLITRIVCIARLPK